MFCLDRVVDLLELTQRRRVARAAVALWCSGAGKGFPLWRDRGKLFAKEAWQPSQHRSYHLHVGTFESRLLNITALPFRQIYILYYTRGNSMQLACGRPAMRLSFPRPQHYHPTAWTATHTRGFSSPSTPTWGGRGPRLGP